MLSVRTAFTSLLLAAFFMSAAPTASAAGRAPVHAALLRHEPGAAPLRVSTSFEGATVRKANQRRVTVHAWGNVQGACTATARNTAAAMAHAAAQDLLSELDVTRAPRRLPKVVFRDAFGGDDGFELRCEARVEMTAERAGRPRLVNAVR